MAMKNMWKRSKTENMEEQLKFWIRYTGWMHLYHAYARCIQIGDSESFAYCLPKLVSLFCAFNHQNYARRLVTYHDNLLKSKGAHPVNWCDSNWSNVFSTFVEICSKGSWAWASYLFSRLCCKSSQSCF